MVDVSGDAPVLVTGATGQQGNAVVKALLARKIPVRALVRDPSSDAAKALKAAGAEIAVGDLNDVDSLQGACKGARSVFSMQVPDREDLFADSEKVRAGNLIKVAKEQGVPQFIQTTVSGTSNYEEVPGWEEGRWDTTHISHYWKTKAAIEELVRSAGFKSWTILRPAFFNENFVSPSFMFVNWDGDELITAVQPDSHLALIAVDDIGVAVAEAVLDSEKFNRVELELAGDWKPMKEIAAILSDAWGLDLVAPTYTVDEVLERGMVPQLVVGQEWLNEFPPPARPEAAAALGIKLTDFDTWAHRTPRNPSK